MSLLNRRRVLIGAGAAIVAGGVAGGIWWSQRPEEQGSTTAISLRLAWIPQATFSGDYAAELKGFWRDRNLTVTINPGGFQYDSIRLVAAKTDFIGIASWPEVLEARANGVPIVAVGVVIPDSPIVWVAKAESGISTPQDFIGKKVGSQVGTLTEITLEALFARLNLPLNRIERVPMQFDYQPFLSGALDVAPCYIIDQVVGFRRQGIALNIIDPRPHGINLGPGNLYFVHQDSLRERPEVIRQFLAGAAAGWQYANANRDEVSRYIARFAEGVGADALKAQMDAVFEFIGAREGYPGTFPISQSAIATTAQTLKRYGTLRSNFDESSMWDNSLLLAGS